MSTDNAILASLARIESLLSQLLALYAPPAPMWYPAAPSPALPCPPITPWPGTICGQQNGILDGPQLDAAWGQFSQEQRKATDGTQ